MSNDRKSPVTKLLLYSSTGAIVMTFLAAIMVLFMMLVGGMVVYIGWPLWCGITAIVMGAFYMFVRPVKPLP